MKVSRLFVAFIGLFLAGSSAFGQSLFLNFNGTDTFTRSFFQKNKGLALTWSATGGIDDVSGFSGGVVNSGTFGAVVSGTAGVTAADKTSPGFSLYNGISYTISEYVQVNSIGVKNDVLLALALAQKTFVTSTNDVPLVGVTLGNADGTNLGVEFVYQDPVKNEIDPTLLTSQPGVGDWVKLTLIIQETDVATGAFSCSVQVDDFGPTGVGEPVSLLAPTPGTIPPDPLLGGKVTSDWIPLWKTTVPGNAFDNLAAGPTWGLGNLIAAKGDTVGSDNAKLSVAGPAAIDAAGDVAFHVTVTGSNVKAPSGILLYSGSTITVVAKAGNDNETVFSNVSDPVLSGSGALAFIGTLKTGTNGVTAASDSGVFVYSGSTSLVAQTSGSAPIGQNDPFTSLTYTKFSQIVVNNAGGIDFLATVKESPGVSTTGLFATDAAGNLQSLTIKGNQGSPNTSGSNQGPHNIAPSFFPFVPLPFVGGQSRTFDTVNGNGTLVGELDPPNAQAIGLATTGSAGTPGFTISNLVETTGTVPNLLPVVVTIKSLHEPIVNAKGSVAFEAVLTGSNINVGNNTGIGLVTTGTQGIFWRIGDPAPDATGASTSGSFAKLSDPVLNNNDAIAFVGALKTSGTSITGKTDTGIWSSAQGTLKRLAREGDPAPGGGTFSSFNQIVLPDVEDVIFTATLASVPSGMNMGIFAVASDGSIILVSRTGVLMPVHSVMKTIKSLQIFQQAAFVLGQSRSFDASTSNLVYQATFTDGTWGIYVATFK